jgi:hypothetical protein
MTDLISELWEGLREAGLPEVMLYLSDGTASRCHWDQTTQVGDLRVALLGDQERNIVRILPLRDCIGIGVASPKGTDPLNFRSVVQERLVAHFRETTPAT